MSDKERFVNTLESMGLQKSRIKRAFRIHDKNYVNHPYNLDVLVEIIVRLQTKDKKKLQKKSNKKSSSNKLVKSKKKKSKKSDMWNYGVISSSHQRKNSNKYPESVADTNSSASFNEFTSSVLQPSIISSSPVHSFMGNYASNFNQSSMNYFPDNGEYENEESLSTVNIPNNSYIPGYTDSSNSALAIEIQHKSPKPSYTDSCNDYSHCVIDDRLMNVGPFMVGENVIFKEKFGSLLQGQIVQIYKGKCKISFPIQVQMHERGFICLPFQEIQHVSQAMAETKSTSCSTSSSASTSENSDELYSLKMPDLNRSSSVEKKYTSISNINNTSIDTFNSSKYYSAPSSPIIPSSPAFPSFQPFPNTGQFSNSQQSLHINHSQHSSNCSPAFGYVSSYSMDDKLNNNPMFGSHSSYGNVNQLKIRVNVNNMIKKRDVPPFEDHMSFMDAKKLRKNDLVDHRDPFGRCALATIVQKEGTIVKIHYVGWKKKWDNWSDYITDIYRFAKAGTISKRIAYRFQELKIGDYVDVNPTLKYPGWIGGQIRRMDKASGQAQIVYELGGKRCLYWVHLDNVKEVAQFATKSGVSCMQKEIEFKISAKQADEQEEKQEMEKYPNLPFVHPSDKEQINFREYCFPLLSPDEQIINPFNTGDWLEVKDMQTQEWMSSVVIDKGNNWIIVNIYDDELKCYEKLHCIKHRSRWRRKNVEYQNKLNMNNESIVFSSAIYAKNKVRLTAGNLEFKYFYDRQMRSVAIMQREEYYSKFISLGYNDIELVPYLVKDNLKKEIKMSPIHMRMFIANIEIFKKSKQDFEDWMVKELEMKPHLRKFLDERIITFEIFRRRIKSLEGLLDIIGFENENDGRKIWKKLPWMNAMI